MSLTEKLGRDNREFLSALTTLSSRSLTVGLKVCDTQNHTGVDGFT
jgi:hypothetical protein